MPRARRRAEENQVKLFAASLFAQQGIDPEQEFKHRSTTHRRGLFGITGKSEGDGPAVHIRQLVGKRLGIFPAATGDFGMFDTGQFADVTTTGSDDQSIIIDRSGFQLQDFVCSINAGDAGLNILDIVLFQEIVQWHYQVLVRALAGRHPDQTGVIKQFGAWGGHADLALEATLSEGFYRRASSEACPGNDDMMHCYDLQTELRWLAWR